KNFAGELTGIARSHPGKRLEIWFQDEARVGQKATLTRLWAPRAIRARAIRDHRFKSAYIFGAVCPQRDTGVALVMTRVSTEAMT
ncbi:IS630 family transposase, partial [Acinetobacter baumannii]